MHSGPLGSWAKESILAKTRLRSSFGKRSISLTAERLIVILYFAITLKILEHLFVGHRGFFQAGLEGFKVGGIFE